MDSKPSLGDFLRPEPFLEAQPSRRSWGSFDTRNCSILINASELGECGGNRVDFFLLRRERCECVLSVRSLRHNSYDKDSLV